ncbi:MAG TPA: hypothetical protein VE650_18760 [Acetobacteraceae bacterium]|nr:hypothetical protein [Acetobacteraceae bacterium]
MSELLWTCEDGSVFSSESNGLRLTVVRAPVGAGFRYQLLRQSSASEPRVSLASGHREQLSEAITAAERTARTFGTRQSEARRHA